MTGLLGKIFGKKKQSGGPEALVDEILDELFSLAGLELGYDLKVQEDGSVNVDIFGEDEELLISKEGQLLDSIQLFVRRSIQHQANGEAFHVNIDCSNFRQQADAALVALAEKLKGLVLDKGKSVYFRALPPKDRKVVHQYLAEDGRVKSRSVGDGHFKKIKIYLAKGGEGIVEEKDGATESR